VTLRLDSPINRNRLILQVFIGSASLAKTALFRLKYASNLTAWRRHSGKSGNPHRGNL